MKQLDHYYIRDSIGDGGFGDVYLGIHKETSIAVAIKVIPTTIPEDSEFHTNIELGIDILCEIDHPCIYKFFDFIRTEEKYYLIFEYLDNGKLLDFVNDHGRLLDKTARQFFTQLISALKYLHEKSIAHRDIKAENILLDRYFNFRLIDFGLSNYFNPDFPIMQTICGCTIYASPEMIKGQRYTPSTDIWSAGVLLYTACAGHFPFYDENKSIPVIIDKILNTEPEYPNYFNEDLVDLLKKMLIKDSLKRISIKEIIEHPWFKKDSLPYEFDSITDNMHKINKTVRRNSIRNQSQINAEPVPSPNSLLDQELLAFIRENYRMDTDLVKTDFEYEPNSKIRVRPNNETVTYLILKRLMDTDRLSKFYKSPYEHLPGGANFSVIVNSERNNSASESLLGKFQNLHPNQQKPIKRRTLSRRSLQGSQTETNPQ